MHGFSFENKQFVWSLDKDTLKLYYTINKLRIILHYSLSLNTFECSICQIYITRIVIY